MWGRLGRRTTAPSNLPWAGRIGVKTSSRVCRTRSSKTASSMLGTSRNSVLRSTKRQPKRTSGMRIAISSTRAGRARLILWFASFLLIIGRVRLHFRRTNGPKVHQSEAGCRKPFALSPWQILVSRWIEPQESPWERWAAILDASTGTLGLPSCLPFALAFLEHF